eukprot:CAMPEP_0181329812 /NCGR_PEP_ID=MMETSP1101-20121128/23529_1 /TAXON_ID=46948 /ORGANISM="Rhodomonas abbreviata, Strain Caron Lab Isolate" /LENGTH=224 /DNA_ID=CAMNT_0023438953 /DNA_START=9 /DNA_END=684 /DNA_ORIENTATION=-
MVENFSSGFVDKFFGSEEKLSIEATKEAIFEDLKLAQSPDAVNEWGRRPSPHTIALRKRFCARVEEVILGVSDQDGMVAMFKMQLEEIAEFIRNYPLSGNECDRRVYDRRDAETERKIRAEFEHIAEGRSHITFEETQNPFCKGKHHFVAFYKAATCDLCRKCWTLQPAGEGPADALDCEGFMAYRLLVDDAFGGIITWLNPNDFLEDSLPSPAPAGASSREFD